MTKLNFETLDLTVKNIAKIAEVFPGVVAEGKVNFELLRSQLGDEVFGDEAYEFTWVGKRDAIAEAGRPIHKTLRPCVEESKNWETTENLYVEGDNLDVLKLLQESYLGKVKMNDVCYAPSEYTQDLLSETENNIKPDRTDLDLLFGCLLDWGLPLSMPHTSEQIDNFTVHTYNDGDLIACFDKHISEKTMREIAERKPLRAVFCDASFSSSPEKINMFEIFKLLAPNTKVKVI